MANDSSSLELAGLAIDPGARDFVLPSTDELRALGVRWIRYLVTQQFQNLDTGQNSELDFVIDRYRDLGVNILLLINAETVGGAIPSAHSADWQLYNQRMADVAQKIAAYYRGKINAIEVFNEPESNNVTADDYAALLSACYPKIKAVSDVTVVSSGICCGLNHDYLKRVIQLAPNMFDFVSWHPYGLRVEGYPSADWGMGDLRDSVVRARAIAGKPLWLTELGAEINYQWPSNSEQCVAEYLKRCYSLFRFLGSDVVAHAFWFTWRNWGEGWGLCDNSGNRRPAWYALQQQTGVVAPPAPSISRVSFSPTTFKVGELLNVSITVRNDSFEPLPTQAPEPGFVYDEGKNFYHYDCAEVAGNFRVGVDFDGRSGIDHPYRWGLGTPLKAGEERTITGAIRMTSAQSKNYWAGLVQERVAWHHDQQGAQAITVEPVVADKPKITAVAFSPTALAVGDLVRVSITVANNSGETLQTQGPEPGFVYDEGDTFRSRGFIETNGSFRVGIDFDGRSGIDHPYRWGLGSSLAPGETRTITGVIRMKNVQTCKYWAGLVQEQIAWHQDNQGIQRIAVSTTTGKPRITNVTFTPTDMTEPGLMNVSITVENSSNSILETQGPNPGFVYDEGDTFYSRGYPDVARAFRVGIDFDNWTGVDHPFRWGLGAPMQPGETRTITGAIGFKRAQIKNYWAGLVQEQVMWVESVTGAQEIIVKPKVAPRVVHVHDLGATTNWSGQFEYSSYIDQSVVNSMVERGMLALTQTANAVNAWRAILPNYVAGQGIAIKVNFTNGGNGNLDAPIQTVNAVIRGLLGMGVQANDIWVYSARDKISDAFVQACAYPGVRFFDNGAHELATFDSPVPSATITFLPPSQVPPLPIIKVTDVLVNATYVINLPIFKAHITGAGLTLGFKNHQGSHNNPSGLHPYIFPGGVYFRADYNPLVDLNRNPNIGGKTVLTIGDALFAGNAWNSPALAFQTFGGKAPNSLFFSTDPVAIDCVMYDFIGAEWHVFTNSGNYLRLASEAGMGVYERGDPWGSGYQLIDYHKI
jgi:hypothetical protein